MSSAFLNSVAVAIPATVIPILIAAFAAYGFAWMKFPGRKALFVVVVALLVVPLQLALIPVLKDYVSLKLNGTYLAVWLAHTGFGLPLAIYLLFNYISTIPRDIFESAFIDGASHFTIFTRLVLPLSVPALASFAIFQFMWVWNDYLVALVFIGSKPDVQVMTMRPGRYGWLSRSGLACFDRWCIHFHAAAPGGFLCPPTLFRPWFDGRISQRLINFLKT